MAAINRLKTEGEQKRINRIRLFGFCVLAISLIVLAILFETIGVYYNSKLFTLFVSQTVNEELPERTVRLNDELAPFDWDVIYCFNDNETKGEIEKTIGIKSRFIETHPFFNTNTTTPLFQQYIFVRGKTVVGVIAGTAEEIGFAWSFDDPIKKNENAELYSIYGADGIIHLFKEEWDTLG